MRFAWPLAPCHHRAPQIPPSPAPPLFEKAKKQICQYARGQRTVFDLPYKLEGTPFQLKVWQAIARIPFGERKSYKDLAIEVGSPLAYRAVGGACHRNPLPLVIACHRVVGARPSPDENRYLTGFAGGLPLKKRLLAMEQAQRDSTKPSRFK